jgi:peptidoglycan/LPS O-acetylase OafA/YrhL
MNKTSHYYPQLDSLRFLAFLLVLIHHSRFAKNIPIWVVLHDFGWVGVDLFLCLSAFLFAKLLFVEFQEKGKVNVGYFYLRRLLRIWPLYFFFIAMMLMYYIFKNGWTSSPLIRLLGMVTFTDNLFSMGLGYNNTIKFVTHLWTISYEEQFYLVIPWALTFLYRQKAVTSWMILVSFILIGTVIRTLFIYYQVGSLSIYVFPLTHFESIIGGLIIGLGLLDRVLKKIPGWLTLISGLIALWGVTQLPNVDKIQWKLMISYPLVGIGFSLILFAILQGELGPISVLMKNKGLSYLGKISYGLYVYHLLGITLTTKIINLFLAPSSHIGYRLTVLITSVVLTILISSISYRVLEKPFLKIKSRFTFIQSRTA